MFPAGSELTRNGGKLLKGVPTPSLRNGKLVDAVNRSKTRMMDRSKALVRDNSAPVERLTRVPKGHKIPKINRGGGTPIDTSGWSIKRPEIPARTPKQAFSKSSLDLDFGTIRKTPR